MSTNTIFFLVAILSVASAFNNKATVTLMARISVPDVNTVIPSSRGYSTAIYGSRARSLLSPSSLSRMRQQQTSTRTRLQFSDNASSNTTIESSWWRKLFTAYSPSPNRSSTITSSSDRSSLSESEEQENVDAYLEFLNSRYRRLHCDDGKEENAQLIQHDSSASKKGKPFSAMDWLTNGGNNSANVVTSTREQQADALYVLGVAGLASQKLLQRHHLPTTTNPPRRSRMISQDTSSNEASALAMKKVVELKEQIDDAIEVNDESDTKSRKTDMNYLIVNKFLLPIVRVIYLALRQKQKLLNMVQRKVTVLSTKFTDGLINTFAQGPKSLLNAVLTFGGGRQNILRTMAIGYGTIVFFRPLLHAVFAEGLAFDPLLQ